MYDVSSCASRSKATKDAGVVSASMADPAVRRVDPLGERVEVEAAGAGDDHLTVDDASRREVPAGARRPVRGSIG